ncbi:hypothetical protein CYMTET_32559 [Cymbomonas tetramitiformis]|uniref:Uncharacterized protein n=1 Tax=Cymbomonas tetramitiformis TaxID=36881 RepID=A0AAE0KRU0_9CHLO|nr:hypothetical protein CYMTET_32559 [Cymbomonas tetramitiformis]
MFTEEVALASLQNKMDYCDLHDDVTCHLRTSGTDVCTSFVWEKEFSLLRHLRDHEWLLWADCDALITNFSRPLSSIVDAAGPDHNLIVIEDHNYYNLGVLMLRSGDWAEWLITELLKPRDVIEYSPGAWRDTKSFRDLVAKHPEVISRIKVVEKKRLQSYDMDWDLHDFIYHQPNCKYNLKTKMDGVLDCRRRFLSHSFRISGSPNGIAEYKPRSLALEPDQYVSLSHRLRCLWRRMSQTWS